MGGLAAERGEFELAVPILSASEALLNSFGVAWWPADRIEVERNLELVRSAVEPSMFETLWNRGEKFSLDEAVKYAEDAIL